MKATFLSLATACALLLSNAAVAQDHHDRDANYGYDKNHKVTPQERARWEAQHRNDRHDDKDDHRDGKRNDHRDDKHEHRDKDFNYGYDKNHKVTPQERARWEAQHRNDHR